MQKNLTDSAYHAILAKYLMERYRSGHNGADSKSVRPKGLVGSNPTRSAIDFSSKQERFTLLKTLLFIACTGLFENVKRFLLFRIFA